MTQTEVTKRLWRDTIKNLLTQHQICGHLGKAKGRGPSLLRTPPQNADSLHLYVRVSFMECRISIATNISAFTGIPKDYEIF